MKENEPRNNETNREEITDSQLMGFVKNMSAVLDWERNVIFGNLNEFKETLVKIYQMSKTESVGVSFNIDKEIKKLRNDVRKVARKMRSSSDY